MQVFRKHKLLIFFLFASAILTLNLVQHQVKGAGRSLVLPLQAFFWEAGSKTSLFISGIIQGPSLFSKLEELQEENLKLQQDYLSAKELEAENIRLREALDLELKKEFVLTELRVVGKDASRDILLVNKGAAQGATEGLAVIAHNRVVAGYIGKVFENTSELVLLSDKESSLGIQIQGKDVVAVLKGQGGFKATLDLVPLEHEFGAGDVLVTSSLGGVFPENLLVGAIQSIEKSDLEAFQQGAVELFFHPQRSSTLFLISEYAK